MRDFGNKPGAGSAIADDDAVGVPAVGKSTLTSALAPGGVPAVQRKDDASNATAAAVDAESAGAVADEAIRADEDWKPATGTKTTTLTGTFGDYTVEHGLTKAPDPTKSDGWGDYHLKITMTPNTKTGTSTIAFVQVVRRGEISGAWHTKATDPFMGAERAKRTDPKSGFKVDRYDATKAKTPFYGMQKGSSGVSETSNTHAGKHGGDKPWMKDTPGVGPNAENAEFVATATDQSDGTQFDAVKWGYKYESTSKTYAELTPVLIKAGSAEIAGRDRAIKKWNDDIATSGSGIDKAPVKDDPAGTASTLAAALGAAKVDEAAVTSTLKAITDADLRARVAACYEMETGRKLSDDLKAKLSATAAGGLTDWTK
jgi:hypothetical protein